MNRVELLKMLESLNLDSKEYWLITGGAMVFYGFRQETGDLDLGCTSKLADELEAKGHPVEIMPDGTRKICPAPDVEIFENWIYDQVEIVDGIPVISVSGLISMKKSIGREKDLKDIQLIERYLDDHEGEAICPSFQNRSISGSPPISGS